MYSARPGLVGHAKFSYKNKGGKKVKTGPFEFSSSKQATDDKRIIILEESWTGNYDNDLKEGRWEYKHNANTVSVSEVEEQNVKFKLITQRSSLRAKYEKGVPQGVWEYLRERIEKTDEIVNQDIQVGFKDGLLDGDVFCTIDDSMGKAVISGQAIKGLLRGTWKIKFEDYTEIRKYKRGVLLELTRRTENDTLLHLVYPLSDQIKRTIADTALVSQMESSGRLNFRDGYPTQSEYVRYQKEGNDFLKAMLVEIYQYDPHLFNDKFYPLGSYRAKYPFSKEEAGWFSELDSLYQTYSSILRRMEDEELLSLELSRDTAVVLVFNWLQSELSMMTRVEDNVTGNLKHSLEYTFREGLVLDSAHHDLGESMIEVLGDTVNFIYTQKQYEEDNLLEYLVNNFKRRIVVADSLNTIFIVKAKALQLDQALILRNEKITQLVKELDSSIKANTKDPSLNRLVRNVHDHYLMDVVNREYQTYLQEVENKEHQAILGDSILLELHSIEEVYRLCQKIAFRRRDIDSLYTEYTFDPFTFTDRVPTRMQRKIYDLIAVQMFNQLVLRATDEKNAFDCERDLRELYKMQGTLYDLRGKETKKLEKKLKKTKDLDERLKILYEAV